MKLTEILKQSRIDKVPAGWLTNEQLAKKEGASSVESFAVVLREAVKAGLVEMKEFKVRWGRFVRARPHYRRIK